MCFRESLNVNILVFASVLRQRCGCFILLLVRPHASEESEMAKRSMMKHGFVVTEFFSTLEPLAAQASIIHSFVAMTAFARNLLASLASGCGRAVGCCDDDGLVTFVALDPRALRVE